jgi:hypothetical protein
MFDECEARFCSNASFVKQLARSNTPDDFKKAMRKANNEQVKTLDDLTFNMMKKKFPVSPKVLKFIKSNRKQLRHLCIPNFSLKSKKRYI